MDLETYRQDVLRTVRPDMSPRDGLLLGALGLSGEAGEVADALKKALFHGHPIETEALRDELGDVLWYVTFLCHTLGLSVTDVMAANVAKRQRRYPDGFSPERSLHRDDAGASEW